MCVAHKKSRSRQAIRSFNFCSLQKRESTCYAMLTDIRKIIALLEISQPSPACVQTWWNNTDKVKQKYSEIIYDF
jgi:hypothetical protein